MVKKSLPFLVAFLVLMLAGCADSSGASAGKIIPPSKSCPLGGKWTVLQELSSNGNKEVITQQWTGSSVQFAESTVAFGGHVWDNLSYKIKRVNASDYLMTKYVPLSGISIKEAQKVDVITVYAAANFLGEVMKLDDKNMIFFVQNKGLVLKKVSDQADRLGGADTNSQELNQDIDEGISGVLLGLRIPSGAGYTYRTLWIAADHHQLHPVLEARQIFFPRTSGFWELKVQDIFSGGKKGSILMARNAAAKPLELNKAKGNGEEASADSSLKAIDYIGNDYVAVERNTDDTNRLQVLPVDKLSSPTEIKVSDLLGNSGLDAYLNAREQAVSALKAEGAAAIDKDESGENFSLTRKNGHWYLVGRINYQNGGTPAQTDFNLKVIPPDNLIFYDTLVLSWHNIKDRVPDAMDAFTSPSKDIALVKTKNKLMIYPIGAEQLEESPLAEINLQEGETVIMAEWATGSYVDNWEKSFLAYGAQALPDGSVRIR